MSDTARRHYIDACAAAHALDLVGERWALLVVRELMVGPRRFTDLRSGLPGISANVLTQRLEGLESAGVLARRRLPPPASVQVYELTPWGYELEPVLKELGRWAARSPRHDPSLPISAASLILSMRTMFDPSRAGGIDLSVGLRTRSGDYLVRVSGGQISAEPGDTAGADLVLSGEPAAIAAILYGGAPVEALIAGGSLSASGDSAILPRFAGLFPLPEKVDAPNRAAPGD